MKEQIACLGAGRMGRGIAVVFAYAGHPVKVVDFKARSDDDFRKLEAEALGEIRTVLTSLAAFGMFDPAQVDTIVARVIDRSGERRASRVLLGRRDLRRRAGSARPQARGAGAAPRNSQAPPRSSPRPRPPFWSMTSPARSSIPERFLNAHWLNPAYLVPLVEMSPGKDTDPAVTARLKAMLEGIGKVPVICAARPGYIVPRIQSLAMNEAARMVEEGIASAEDLDKAIKYGFGFRFAVLGMLEFIDWGGGDILYYASRYLTKALDNERYASPDIVEHNMKEGHIGLKTQRGFLNYEGMDVDAYRAERLKALAGLLKHFGLVKPPVV